MIYHTTLNNYQMGSYSYNVLANKIVSETRLTPYTTRVVWNLNDSEYALLQKVLGCKKLYEGNCINT